MDTNSKKSIYNIAAGLVSQLVIAVMGIILPRLFITSYGSEVNGFLSSISQIFSYVALLEAGVGTATLQALYKPVALHDEASINGILAATSKFYRRTGIGYLSCVGILAVIYPLFIGSEIPVWQQIGVILIVGVSGSIGYFVHAKYGVLMSADGKSYIATSASIVVQISLNLSKVIMILCGLNIVFIQLGHMVLQLGYAFYIYRRAKKIYPWVDLHVTPDVDAISESKFVLVHQISSMVFNHTDILILTIFTNLKVVSVYTLYNTIFDIIASVISNINNGFTFRLGQLYGKDVDRYKKTFSAYETCYMALAMALYTVTYIFALPFMSIYMRGVTDANYLDHWIPVLFFLIKVLVSGRALSGCTITFAGKFRDTQKQTIAESVINLVVSIVGVYYLGIYGVLIGTVAALLYRTNDMIIYTGRKILQQSVKGTYAKWLLDCALAILLIGASILFPIHADNYILLIAYAAIYTVIALTIFSGVNYLLFRKQLGQVVVYCKGMISALKRKRHR